LEWEKEEDFEDLEEWYNENVDEDSNWDPTAEDPPLSEAAFEQFQRNAGLDQASIAKIKVQNIAREAEEQEEKESEVEHSEEEGGIEENEETEDAHNDV
jgi:hypothetical protein